MFAALASRLTQAVLVMLVVTACAFLMFRFVGDPVRVMAREDATPQEKAELAKTLGLDQPIIVQYGKFLGRVERLETSRQHLWSANAVELRSGQASFQRLDEMAGE